MLTFTILFLCYMLACQRKKFCGFITICCFLPQTGLHSKLKVDIANLRAVVCWSTNVSRLIGRYALVRLNSHWSNNLCVTFIRRKVLHQELSGIIISCGGRDRLTKQVYSKHPRCFHNFELAQTHGDYCF